MPRAASATPGSVYVDAPELQPTPVPYNGPRRLELGPLVATSPAYNGPALRELSPAPPQRPARTATAPSVAKVAHAAEVAHLKRIAKAREDAQQGVAPPAARGKPNRAGGLLRF